MASPTSKSKIIDQHHVVRYCKKRLTIRQDNKVVALFPDCLFLRQDVHGTGPEEYLSCVYYEYFEGKSILKMPACEKAIRLQSKSDNDVMFRLNVGIVREQGRNRKRNIAIWYRPNASDNPAYGGMDGFPLDPDVDLVQNILEFALVELATIKQIRESGSS
jgi:hypothetical protein